MAIARDTSASININTNNGSPNNATVAYTNNGSVILLTVTNNTSSTNATAAVYGGSAMTKLVQGTLTGDDTSTSWILYSPPTGANNLVVTMAGVGVINVKGAIASWSGTGTSSNTSLNTEDANDASNTHSITPTVANCWAILAVHNADANPVAGTGSNLVVVNGGAGIFDSNGTIPSGSPYSMTITVAGTRAQIWSQIAIAPPSVTNSRFFNFMPN